MISFGATVVAAIVIGACIAKARAKKKEAENINQDDEYSDTASDDTPIQIG